MFNNTKIDVNQKIFKYFIYYPTVYLRGQNVPKYIKQLLASQYYSTKELEKIQSKKLNNLLRYAINNIPYYKSKIAKQLNDTNLTIEHLKTIAPVNKEFLKNNPINFLSEQQLLFLTKKTTGGSTGQPVTILKTRDAMARELAATWRGYNWAGIDIGDRQGRFWGIPITKKAQYQARLIDFLTNRLRCSAFSFDENNLEFYTNQLAKIRPKYFYGYVSMLVEYAQYFKSIGKNPPFNLHCIITTSEVLTESHRLLLQNVFECKVYNEYGSGELGSVAHECEKESLHIMAENMIVEILNGNNPCQPGEVGELVITELNNFAMPLIRYRTGDLASLSVKQCDCGRSLPIIDNLVGRAYDMIHNKDGKLFHGEFFMYIFEEAKRRDMGIGAFQVIQKKLDEFLIKIKKEAKYSNMSEDFIVKRIQSDFDKDATVNFEYVEKIPRLPSGKMQLIVGMH